MAKPPIQLVNNFFAKTYIEANHSAMQDIKAKKAIGYHMAWLVQHKKQESEERLYQVSLTVSLHEKQDHIMAYKAEIQAVGFVKVEEHIDAGRQENFAVINGASILYGAIREYLYMLTSRGPFEPVYLPTVSFMPASIHEAENQQK